MCVSHSDLSLSHADGFRHDVGYWMPSVGGENTRLSSAGEYKRIGKKCSREGWVTHPASDRVQHVHAVGERGVRANQAQSPPDCAMRIVDDFASAGSAQSAAPVVPLRAARGREPCI